MARLYVTQNGAESLISSEAGESFLSALRRGGADIAAPCGGNGTCGRCKIRVTGTAKELQSNAPDLPLKYNGGELLACRFTASGDCKVVIPDDTKMNIQTGGVGDIEPCGEGLGVAVDIGTTTVAAFLYDLSTGLRIADVSGRSAQRAYGADVISRIQYCSTADGLDTLMRAVRGQIDAAIDSLCREASRKRSEITYVSIAGNTVMQHIFTGLDPTGIGVAPFTPVSLFGDTRPASEFFTALHPKAELYLAPAIAGYVGGDVTAGLLSSGAADRGELCFYLDIGTNGEMGLGDKDGYLCCATAAGPAFEGAEIECGMDASTGAIDRVQYADGKPLFHVIGDVPATGICGSGLIDAIAVLLECGVIEESGRMLPSVNSPASAGVKSAYGAGMRFHFTDEVYISARDVRQIQQAKAAIRTGIETLLTLRGCKYEDIGIVLVAGGFGAYMDVVNACAIGLLPPAFEGKTRHIGNSAGYGAAMALAAPQRETLSALVSRCEYVELSSEPLFRERYVEELIFDD